MPSPLEDSFYAVPEGLESVRPGTILKHRKPPAPIAAFGAARINLQDSHQILYRTSDSSGNATATVLTVLIPHNADFGKVLSYQVLEDAAYARCAPSYVFQFGASTGGLFGTVANQAELLLIEAALEEGWVVVAPDYQGPRAAFLANKLAGHSILDGIRAALSSGEITGIRGDATVSLWGYSGGCVATTFAVELQPSYAPELGASIAGAALGGPVPDLSSCLATINKGPLAGLIPAGIIGLSAEYPALAALVDEQLLPRYREKFYKAGRECLVANLANFLLADVFAMAKDRAIFSQGLAKTIMDQNSAGQATPKVPLFIYKAIHDEVSPIRYTDELVKGYCDKGASVEYVKHPEALHSTLSSTGAPAAFAWLKGIMSGKKKPDKKCSTKVARNRLWDRSTYQVMPKFIADALLDLMGKPVGPGGLLESGMQSRDAPGLGDTGAQSCPAPGIFVVR